MSLGPNFLIIGAAKSGTTSLCHYLRQHPDIFVAREKESHHFLFADSPPTFVGPGDQEEFNPLVISDRERYEQCFTDGDGYLARGEASVYYLYRPESVERALEYNPEMKFLTILRNPVDRAFSAWSHMIRDGREPEANFLTAVDQEPERAAAGWSYGFFYESVGRYAAQIRTLRDLVPPDQHHVLFYEDLVLDLPSSMAATFDFLNVQNYPVKSSTVMNASGRPRLKALNSLLTQRNALKAGLKRVLPYDLGSNLAHRVRNWNLESIDIAPQDARTLGLRYEAELRDLSDILEHDLIDWRPTS